MRVSASEINDLHAHICQALSEPKRIVILYALSEKPYKVTELADEYDIPQPTVSRHLKLLKDRGLVTSERDGTSVVYSLTDDRVIQALDIMRSILADVMTYRLSLAMAVDELG